LNNSVICVAGDELGAEQNFRFDGTASGVASRDEGLCQSWHLRGKGLRILCGRKRQVLCERGSGEQAKGG